MVVVGWNGRWREKGGKENLHQNFFMKICLEKMKFSGKEYYYFLDLGSGSEPFYDGLDLDPHFSHGSDFLLD